MATGSERLEGAEQRASTRDDDALPVVLLAVANDRVGSGRLRNLAEERRAIQRQLEGRAELVVIPDALLSEVWDAFDDPRLRGRIEVFHFAGHAGGSWLAFEDEGGAPAHAGADDLAGFLGRQEGLVLVFLNGCSTLAQVRRLREGVPAVIATTDAIDDAAAAELAGRFYAGLRTKSLERAFVDAEDFLKSKLQGDPRGATRELEPEREDERAEWPWLLDCDDAHRGWRLRTPVPRLRASPSPRPPKRERPRWIAPAIVVGALAAAAVGAAWVMDLDRVAVPRPAQVARLEPVVIEMKKIPKGSVRVCPDPSDSADCTQVEEPSFCLGSTELTQGQWERLFGVNPSWSPAGIGDDLPVDNITWDQALEAADRLSAREGRTACYHRTARGWSTIEGCDGYRLPTDLEWDHLSREQGPAGCDTSNLADADLFRDALKVVEHYEKRIPGLSPIDCDMPGVGDGHARLAPVGSMAVGPFGISDLQGNVAEWVWSSVTPGGVDLRGHSFAWPGRNEEVLLVLIRTKAQEPGWKDGAVGMRLARDLPASGDCGSPP